MESRFSSPRNLTSALPTQSEVLGLSWHLILLPLLLYPTLCLLLRHHRLRQTLEEFPYTTPKSFSSMTNEHALYIQQTLSELEFPTIFEKSVQFALFRTYGIPSISKLLVQTGELSEAANAAKRYTDTSVLIAEIMSYDPSSERSVEAIGRMNYIHSQYQKAGKISNDDMLYTLSLFALEPVRWINKYEWRQLEEFEKCAMGTFWKGLGDAMGIDYGKLRSTEWTDGWHWLEEAREWAEGYEKEKMVPDLNNNKTADQTVAILLWSIPNMLKPFGSKVVSVLMDDRLRTAMMYEKPPQFYFSLISLIFTIRKYILRYLCLPRPYIFRYRFLTDQPSKENTYFTKRFEAIPWYVKPTLRNRFGPSAWIFCMSGLPLRGDEGEKYWPRGYKIEQIGPDIMSGKGGEYWRESKERLTRERGRGCPFGRAKVE
ncbi:hypothetical protein ABVK25_007061 [Lepraria finkii]|uniref:ER-bound oxygenase mpaB/mpaB'/Rubber oxygenase catalytic domain-containing protein n=1 Tax=Lepraria finkii TaxID=1340010 RepID=A0ABR4B6I6_9LECA